MRAVAKKNDAIYAIALIDESSLKPLVAAARMQHVECRQPPSREEAKMETQPNQE
jgi:hypothetical protein